ncbi:MAG: Si-specific NAD(P)(+) transhydrogenase [Deltaproteobacteria bacterium]|nr:Si-specific NAD(P)(+) transhydrogenase [Deltaproteobacteria bacterium]
MSDVLDYDLVVIGSGPGGQKAAICAAKLGKRVAIVDRAGSVGGVCVNTGTIPSKTLREAVLHLSGYHERTHYGESYKVKRNITARDLLHRCESVIQSEIEIIKDQLQRNDVDFHVGTARFKDPRSIEVEGDGTALLLSARAFVIAVGTKPAPVAMVEVDNRHVLDSDGIMAMDRLPKTLCVIGAGVIGCEYASMFAALGSRVTLVEQREKLLPFVDRELVDALVYHLRDERLTMRLGEAVESITIDPKAKTDAVRTRLKSGKTITSELALYCAGRQGATTALGLEHAGLSADARGRIEVNAHFQTRVPHIYAVGDVVGFPSLASTAMEQGRMAASHAFGASAHSVPALFPYGIYTIPEMSMVGKTEEELTAANVPYEIGVARYKEIARGQIIGDATGLLKLIFHREAKELLGVHIIGEGASELVHIGQAVMSLKGTLDYFVQTVFNYPTLAECYKVAALDAMNRMRA